MIKKGNDDKKERKGSCFRWIRKIFIRTKVHKWAKAVRKVKKKKIKTFLSVKLLL